MSFNRRDYERLVSMSRVLMNLGRTPGQVKTKNRQMKKIARELFQMCESVIGQQCPPLEDEPGYPTNGEET